MAHFLGVIALSSVNAGTTAVNSTNSSTTALNSVNSNASGLVIIWHYNGIGYSRTAVKNCTVHKVEAVSENGMHQKGYTLSSRAEVRIFTDKRLEIACGDRIAFTDKNKPDYAADYKITAISHNFRGTRPHYHVTAEL